jgi:hypothetical protein
MDFLCVLNCVRFPENDMAHSQLKEKCNRLFSPNHLCNKQCWMVAWLVGDHLLSRDFGPYRMLMNVCVVITVGVEC